MRQRTYKVEWYKKLWVRNPPYIISFFLWRLLKRKAPTDDILRTIGISIVSKCWCYNVRAEETINHLFLTSFTAQKLWKNFVTCASFALEDSQVGTIIFKWWRFVGNLRRRQVLYAIPTILVWELWKMRNSKRMEKRWSTISCNRIV